MYKNRKFHLPVLTRYQYFPHLSVLVLVIVVIYTSLGSAQVDLNNQRGLSAAGQPSLTRIQNAEAARWKGLAESYLVTQTPVLTRAQAAEAARWKTLAEYYLAGQYSYHVLTRAQAAEAARLEALAEYYLAAQTPSLSRAQAAEAARLTGLAIYYGVEPASISPEVLALLGQ
jgi:hypothetical protein